MRIEDEIKQKKFSSDFQKLAVNILFTSSWMSSILNKRLKPFGISQEQFNVLRILKGQFPKPSSIGLITDRMLDKSSNASRIVEKLKLKGLVSRVESKSDRRLVEVTITQSGLDLLDRIDIKQKEWIQIFAPITEQEAAQISDLLDKLRG